MTNLGRICGMLRYRLVQRFDVKPAGVSEHGWYPCSWLHSFALASMLVLLFVSGASAAYKLALGKMSPLTGIAPADLATVHVHIQPMAFNLALSLFDSGSIVVSYRPPKGKGQLRCGDGATDCVCAPGTWIFKSRLSKRGQIREGNEVAYLGTLMYPANLTWQRLPGPMVLHLYINGYPLSGMGSGVVASDEVQTRAGSSYDFDVSWEQVQGGLTIKIRARQ